MGERGPSVTGARHTLTLGFLKALLSPYSEFLTSAEASLCWLHYLGRRVTYHLRFWGPEPGLSL